jgi:hypothetical protein
MELNERIARYLSSTPGAVSGQKGHDQTYFVACTLANGFALPETEIFYWLQQYNARCVPPWSEKELLHKVKQAMNATHSKPRGHLLNGAVLKNFHAPPIQVVKHNLDPVSEIENFLSGFKCSEDDLMEASPVPLGKPEHWTEHGMLLISQLFTKQEKINIVTEYTEYTKKSDGTVKANPHGVGVTYLRDDMLEYIDPAFPTFKASKAGAWIRINAMDGTGISDNCVTSFRHALIEFDSVPVDMQICFLARAPLPISCILTSGDKSVHAWVKMDCADITAYSSEVHMLREVLSRFGIDRSNKNPSRLSRLPGVMREIRQGGDGRQRLLYLNQNPEQKSIL